MNNTRKIVVGLRALVIYINLDIVETQKELRKLVYDVNNTGSYSNALHKKIDSLKRQITEYTELIKELEGHK